MSGSELEERVTVEGVAGPGHGQVSVSTRLLEQGAEQHSFRVADQAPLADVLNIGLKSAGRLLTPMPESPLDLLHNLSPQGEAGPVIEDLEQPTGPYVRQPGTTRNFGIELVRAVRINTRWRIAPEQSMSPRQILSLFSLDFQEYSLYRDGSAERLPLDTPIKLARGAVFEAQRDGKYGEGR